MNSMAAWRTLNDVSRTLAILTSGRHQLLMLCVKRAIVLDPEEYQVFVWKLPFVRRFHLSGGGESVFMLCGFRLLCEDFQVADSFSAPGGSSSATTPSVFSLHLFGK